MTNRTIYARSDFTSRHVGATHNVRAFDRLEDARRWVRQGFKWGAVKATIYYGSINAMSEVIEEVAA